MAYTQDQISRAVEYISKKVLNDFPGNHSLDEFVRMSFTNDLRQTLSDLTHYFPQPLLISFSNTSDIPLMRTFYEACLGQKIHIPNDLNVKIKFTGEVIDCSKNKKIVVYAPPSPEITVLNGEDEYIDPYKISKSKGAKKHQPSQRKECTSLSINETEKNITVNNEEEPTAAKSHISNKKETLDHRQHRLALQKSKHKHKGGAKRYNPDRQAKPIVHAYTKARQSTNKLNWAVETAFIVSTLQAIRLK